MNDKESLGSNERLDGAAGREAEKSRCRRPPGKSSRGRGQGESRREPLPPARGAQEGHLLQLGGGPEHAKGAMPSGKRTLATRLSRGPGGSQCLQGSRKVIPKPYEAGQQASTGGRQSRLRSDLDFTLTIRTTSASRQLSMSLPAKRGNDHLPREL